MLVAAAGLLTEWGTGEHSCVGFETEEEKCEKKGDQYHGYYPLRVKYLVICGLGRGEDVHDGWNGEEDENDHHQGGEDCRKVFIEP